MSALRDQYGDIGKSPPALVKVVKCVEFSCVTDDADILYDSLTQDSVCCRTTSIL